MNKRGRALHQRVGPRTPAAVAGGQLRTATDSRNRSSVPARYFIEMTKGIFLKGTGLRLLWFDLLLLILYAVGISFLAVRKLRQKIA